MINKIYFGSGTKLPELSNFYECLIMDEKMDIYPSVEHKYQSLKFNEYKRFTINGDLGNYGAFIKYKNIFYDDVDDIENKIYYWKNKQCIGIVAKMSADKTRFKKLGLSLKNAELLETEITFDIALKTFWPILEYKFAHPCFRKILLSTNNNDIIEFARHKNKWGAIIKDNEIIGKNWMGKIMMKLRSFIQNYNHPAFSIQIQK